MRNTLIRHRSKQQPINHSSLFKGGDIDLARNVPASLTSQTISSMGDEVVIASKEDQTGIHRYEHETANVPWPQLIWISTAARMPPWRIQFCLNGLPFAHLKPKHSRCPRFQLPRLSEVLVLQLQISAKCISACRPLERSFPNAEHKTVSQCPKECIRESGAYFGGKVSRVNFVNLPPATKSLDNT